MSKNALLLFLMLLILAACQQVQKGDVPKAVKTAFTSKYADESDRDWKMDRNGNFESSFKKDGEHYRADFSPDGKWIETERSIKKKELPKSIRKRLESEYDDFDIVEIEEVDHNSKGLFYDVELKMDGKKKDVEFIANGQIIN